MAKVYYHAPKSSNGRFVIWSHAKSLTEAGKTLAKQNKIWPDSSSDGKIITVGRKKRGCSSIIPTARYRLNGDKLVLECKLSALIQMDDGAFTLTI